MVENKSKYVDKLYLKNKQEQKLETLLFVPSILKIWLRLQNSEVFWCTASMI